MIYELFFYILHIKLRSNRRKGKEWLIWIGRWRQTSIVIFRETSGEEGSEVESHATSSGQLALLARLTHAIPFFLAVIQWILLLLQISAKSFSVKLLWRNVAKFSLVFCTFRWNCKKKSSYFFFSLSMINFSLWQTLYNMHFNSRMYESTCFWKTDRILSLRKLLDAETSTSRRKYNFRSGAKIQYRNASSTFLTMTGKVFEWLTNFHGHYRWIISLYRVFRIS